MKYRSILLPLGLVLFFALSPTQVGAQESCDPNLGPCPEGTTYTENGFCDDDLNGKLWCTDKKVECEARSGTFSKSITNDPANHFYITTCILPGPDPYAPSRQACLSGGGIFIVTNEVPQCVDIPATPDTQDCDPSEQSCDLGGPPPCDPADQSCDFEGPPAPLGGGGETGFVALVPIPGLTDVDPTDVVQSSDLANFLNNLYKYAIGLAAAAAIIQITFGGLEIAFNKDNVSKIIENKGRIWKAITGLILVFMPVVVFTLINPSILRLDLNLGALNNAPQTEIPTDNDTETDPETGCIVSGSLLKKAVCPTGPDAVAWASTACAGAPTDYAFAKNASFSCALEDSSHNCVRAQAYCELVSKPLMFLDISYDWNLIRFFSSYQPIAAIPGNPNNGADAVAFIKGCTQDGGLTCITDKDFFESNCANLYTSFQPRDQSNECYYAKLRCYENSWLNLSSECSSSPSYTPIR